MLEIREAILPDEEHILFRLNEMLSPDESLERFRSDLGRAAGNVFIAADGGVVLGFISFDFPFWNDIAICLHLVVHPDGRGKGIGEGLMKAAVEAARQQGCRFFTAQTAVWNTRGISFYQRQGFVARAAFPDYIGDGNEMMWLEKDLRAKI